MADDLDGLDAAGDITLAEAVAFAASRVRAGRRLSEASLEIFAPIWRGFARFSSRACGVDRLADVDGVLVARFLEASTRTGQAPAVATKHQRRAALRFLFTVLRDVGIASGDPTLDIVLPPRTTRAFRPLTTEEVERCRAAAQATLVATREPAVWALAEIGASGLEIGEARTDAVHGSSVILAGGVKTDPRLATLTTWGRKAIQRRLEGDHEAPWLISTAGSRSAHARRTSALEALRTTMRRAGVVGPQIDPRSVTAWAGQQVLARTGSIEDVARGLGMRSLDRAAELIEHEWRSR